MLQRSWNGAAAALAPFIVAAAGAVAAGAEVPAALNLGADRLTGTRPGCMAS